jgi:hypothetical protein
MQVYRMKIAVALLAAILLSPYAIIPANASGISHTTYSGRAIGVSIHTAILDIKFADTGELPPQGGEIDATVLKVEHALVQAQVLLAVTMGFDKKAESEAATADVVLLPGTANQITAEFVRANSRATCDGASGGSEIASLKLGGQQIDVSGGPNQTVSVPGVFVLIINEQINSSNDKTKEITVNALHLKLATGEEVLLSSAHSDITCGENLNVPKDFVTGGGFINVNNGKADFGFVAGFKPGQSTVSGQLNYIDHAVGIHVKSLSIASYDGEGKTRMFSGEAMINGISGYTFVVTVTDNGEPGRGRDTFGIRLSNGYAASEVLAGGNIQLHT